MRAVRLLSAQVLGQHARVEVLISQLQSLVDTRSRHLVAFLGLVSDPPVRAKESEHRESRQSTLNMDGGGALQEIFAAAAALSGTNEEQTMQLMFAGIGDPDAPALDMFPLPFHGLGGVGGSAPRPLQTVDACLARLQNDENSMSLLADGWTDLSDSQPNSPLASLPRELLSLLCGWLDAATAAALFSSCRALFASSLETTSRVEFLIGNYGTDQAVEGMGHWVHLLAPAVFQGTCRRVGQVPRFQLQRLFRRFQAASRTDLLQPLLAYASEIYPCAPPAPRNRLLTKKHPIFIPNSSDLAASIPDDVLLKRLVTAGQLPHGLEHLVQDGVQGGWSVPDDAVLTAILTLKNKYGLSPDHALAGRSHGGRIVDAFLCTPILATVGDPRCDVFIPGTDAVHALLIQMIRDGNERAVKWLLAFGVNTHHSTDHPAFTKQSMDEMTQVLAQQQERTGIVMAAANLTAVDPATAARIDPFRAALGLIARWCARQGVTSPYPSSENRAAMHHRPTFLGMRGNGPKPQYVNVLDAIEYAASLGRVAILKLLLESDFERGRLFSNQGKATLKRCMLLSTDDSATYEVIRSYCRDGLLDDSVDLLSALLVGDKARSTELFDRGATLTPEQAVAVLSKRGGDVATVHKLVLERVLLPVEQLLELLPILLGRHCACNAMQGLPPHTFPSADSSQNGMPSAELVRTQHSSAVEFLERYRTFWSDPRGRGRDAILGLFGTKQCVRVLLRPFLGDLRQFSRYSPVVAYDFIEAVNRNDREGMIRLLDYGVPCIPALVTAMEQRLVKEPGILTLLQSGRFENGDMVDLLSVAVDAGLSKVVSWLLDPAHGHVVPTVTGNMLEACLDEESIASDQAVEMFCLLVGRAKAQTLPIMHRRIIGGAVRQLDEHDPRQTAWNDYMTAFPLESVEEEPADFDGEDYGDDMYDGLLPGFIGGYGVDIDDEYGDLDGFHPLGYDMYGGSLAFF